VSDASIMPDMISLLQEQPGLSAFMHAPHVIRDRTIYAMTPASVAADVPAVFSAKAMGACNVRTHTGLPTLASCLQRHLPCLSPDH